MTIYTALSNAVAKRLAYLRTRAELVAMPRQTAIDLGLFPEDATKTARLAVYG
ncbi:hypothetical protein [Oceanicola sp. 502str15]|uniref:hypothetical protein n=1 Tax=Oceanicola sp. 502str15 TaxID=2696061 RepID=UPI002095938F|nr:hypothetical protein [Oceanicola sp. 502str15]